MLNNLRKWSNFFPEKDDSIKSWLLILAISFLVFFPTLFATPFWDDWSFIFRNYELRAASSPFYFFSYNNLKAWPLFNSILWILYHTFYKKYFLYHLLSILIHASNGYLFFKILRRLDFQFAFLWSIVYLVHPSHVFVVAWIIQLKTLFSMFFFLLFLHFFIDYIKKKEKLYYFLYVLFFGLSVFTKSTTAVWGVFLFFCYPFFSRRIAFKRFIIWSLPLFLLSVTSLLFTVYQPHQRNFLYLFITTVFLLTLAVRYFSNIKKWGFYLIPLAVFLAVFRMSYNSSHFFLTVAPAFIYFFISCKYKNKIEHSFLYYFLSFAILFFTIRPDILLSILFVQLKIQNILLSIKNLLNYFLFSLFPFKNLLFHPSTFITKSSFEAFSLIAFLIGLISLARFLYKDHNIKALFSLFFFISLIYPFCGLFFIPIFSFSNFNPYWLSIPVSSFVLFGASCIHAKKLIVSILIYFLVITHLQTYQFINTERIFIKSIEKNPQSELQIVSLIEHYLFTEECFKALEVYDKNKKLKIMLEFNITQKIQNCHRIRRDYHAY